jgi:hypothetical protein
VIRLQQSGGKFSGETITIETISRIQQFSSGKNATPSRRGGKQRPDGRLSTWPGLAFRALKRGNGL